jgi:hypothetical protein
VAIVEAARSIIAQATAEPLPPARPVLIIRTAAEAREAFGSGHGLEAFLRPGPVPAVYALPHDPQRSPPVSCRVDVVTVELEQHLDGVWRPRRAESDG